MEIESDFGWLLRKLPLPPPAFTALKHPRTHAALRAIAVACTAILALGISAATSRAEGMGSPSKAVTFEPTNAVDFTFMAIPEPGALISLLGGAGVLIGIQRFRRRA